MDELAARWELDSWDGVVATVLSLVIQHCPGASEDCRDLCKLPQVSTACRTALQHTMGHCGIWLFGPEQKLLSYAAWAQQYPGLTTELIVDITAYDPDVKEFNEQLPAAVAALNGLGHFSLIRSEAVPVFPSSLLDSLSPMTQLKELIINKVAAPTLSSSSGSSSSPLSRLPASLEEMHLVVDVGGLISEPSTNPQHGGEEALGFWDFRNLVGLQYLHLNASMDPMKKAPRLVPVHLPTSITCLELLGPVDVLCGEGVEFPHILEIKARGGKTPLYCIADLISGMPNVTSVHIDGFAPQPGSKTFGCVPCYEPQRVGVFSKALSTATQLTSLHVANYHLRYSAAATGWNPNPPGPEDTPCWFLQLQDLQQLRQLHIGLTLDTFDAIPMLSLTGLTSLTLQHCGWRVTDPVVVSLCTSLTNLEELSVKDSGMCESESVFEAAGQLTRLTVLDFDRNLEMECFEEDLELLAPLTALVELVVPPLAAEEVSYAAIEAFVADMPSLTTVVVRRHSLLPVCVVMKASPLVVLCLALV